MSSELANDTAIRVENLGKCYHIYDHPRDRLKQFVLPHLQRAAGRPSAKYYREFWALKDLNFEVRRGETVGIIGRNGSGKSTLLQLICGTLNPTTGSVRTQGRVSALLELGSGFNPEFTGRENVYMNGAVLGLSMEEVNARFNDIAAFAEIGDFIEQPVKTYSSGMMMRLAFAVAVHVEPDILVVDEALSVGDIAFRNKCSEVIQKMMARGVTILFVTHDLGTLQLLCSRVLWLAHGELRASGDPVRVSQDYYVDTIPTNSQVGTTPTTVHHLPPQQETGKAQFLKVHLPDNPDGAFDILQQLRIEFFLQAREKLPKLVFTVSIYRSDGDWVVGQTSRDAQVFWNALEAGEICSGVLVLEPICLAPGEYLAAFAAYNEDYSICLALTDLCLNFSVRSPFPTWGKFHHPCRWLPGGSY